MTHSLPTLRASDLEPWQILDRAKDRAAERQHVKRTGRSRVTAGSGRRGSQSGLETWENRQRHPTSFTNPKDDAARYPLRCRSGRIVPRGRPPPCPGRQVGVGQAGPLLMHVRVSRLNAKLIDAHTDSRSEEHTSELQSLMRISYAVFCLKKKKQHKSTKTII